MNHIIALGNIGGKYELTRHNIAWILCNELIDTDSTSYNKYMHADVSNLKSISNTKLYKPDTFMNLSGKTALGIISHFSKNEDFDKNRIIVIQDDTAFEVGEYKISYDRGGNGHNGVSSVSGALGSNEYIRVRLGIGASGLIPLKSYVLMKFSADEITKIKDLAPTIEKVIKAIIEEGVGAAMNKYN